MRVAFQCLAQAVDELWFVHNHIHTTFRMPGIVILVDLAPFQPPVDPATLDTDPLG
jgi:hypothetical protein